MEFLGEKVAYLKGLAQGMKVEEASNEGKLLVEIIGVLDAMTDSISEIEDSVDELTEQVDGIDEDLAEVEKDLYEDEDEDDEEDDDNGFFEVNCPSCNEKVYLDEEMLESDEEIICPNCKETIELELDCDCGCCDHDEDKD